MIADQPASCGRLVRYSEVIVEELTTTPQFSMSTIELGRLSWRFWEQRMFHFLRPGWERIRVPLAVGSSGAAHWKAECFLL